MSGQRLVLFRFREKIPLQKCLNIYFDSSDLFVIFVCAFFVPVLLLRDPIPQDFTTQPSDDKKSLKLFWEKGKDPVYNCAYYEMGV